MNPIESPLSENQKDVVADKQVSSSDSVATSPLGNQEQVNANGQVPPDAQTKQLRKGISLPLGIILLVLAFLGGLLLAGWYFQMQLQKINTAKATAVTPAHIVRPQKLIVGTDPTFQPMEYTQKGAFVGYDIDLAHFLAKELGTQVEIKNISFDKLFMSLDQKKVDMIISGLTITDERKQKYDFSNPYLNAGQVIITRKENTTIKTTADIKGKKIAVQQGTTNETEALTHTSRNLVISYPDFVQATKALVDGKVDAIFSDLPGAKGIITANPTLRIASDPFTNEYYGIVFRKGDPNVKQINAALDAIRIKGILTDLKQKWLD